MSGGVAALGVETTPQQPGPGPMPDALLRALELTIGRRVDGLLSGDHRSSLLGRGSELAQIRPYEPGDDVRLIDWNVTARTGEPHVRVQLAERVLVTWLVLDHSPSMSFGTADRRKADVVAGVALAVGRAASVRGNRVGLVSFGAASGVVLPPKQGREGLVGLMSALQGRDRRGGPPPQELQPALHRVRAIARQRSLVVVVSDFRGARNWRPDLIELAGRHEVVAVEVRDPREQELPDVGELTVVDPETGRALRIDTRSSSLRTRFAAAAAAERQELAQLLASGGVPHVVLSTAGDWLRPLAGFLRRRQR
jgi:uncharacterized protein (DUF58 family)